MNSQELINITEKYGAHNYKPLPIMIIKAEGCWVYDAEGNKYLDMLSCYSALNMGHRHPKLIQAAIDQMEKCTLTSRAFYNDQCAMFFKELAEFSGKDMVLPMNSGAEAVETAVKMARRWGYQVKGIEKNKAEIIVCSGNFHGRTTTCVSFSSDEEYRDGFGPFTPGFVTVPYGDSEALKKAINKNTAAFLVEPIQGEAGVVVPPQDYLKECYEACKSNNILFISDEIQTGFGRTGKRFASDHANIIPDCYILGKALGGGILPVSAVVANKDVLGVFNPGSHGSTFGGNPLGTAIARAAIKVLVDEKLADRSMDLGNYLMDRLKSIKSDLIEDIRGKGLFIGILLKKSAGPARPFCEKLFAKGILCKETHDYVIRLAPPLTIKKEELDFAIGVLKGVLENR